MLYIRITQSVRKLNCVQCTVTTNFHESIYIYEHYKLGQILHTGPQVIQMLPRKQQVYHIERTI